MLKGKRAYSLTFDDFLFVQCYYHTSFYLITAIKYSVGIIVLEQNFARCFTHFAIRDSAQILKKNKGIRLLMN